jgi:transcriptional regulator with XRE-family HTH domain
MTRPTPDAFHRAVGQRIATRRVQRGLTQRQVAATAGITRGTLANIERGYCRSPLYRIHAIAAALGTTVDELTGDTT